jgi:hypothetical protein
MIFVDDREGSKELYPRFREEYNPVLVRLDYADCLFVGNGPLGPVNIGIERKVIDYDLLQSISSGRLVGDQLPKMLAACFHVYLIVEGLWRPGEGNVIEIHHKGQWRLLSFGRRFKYGEIIEFINSLRIFPGVTTIFTPNMRSTVLAVEGLYSWWDKPWGAHRAFLAMHKGVIPSSYVALVRTPLLQRIAAELPGVGWERSIHVAKRFSTVEEMVMASEEDWQGIKWTTDKGRNAGFGKVTARQAWEALHVVED